MKHHSEASVDSDCTKLLLGGGNGDFVSYSPFYAPKHWIDNIADDPRGSKEIILPIEGAEQLHNPFLPPAVAT
jgi:hypothetical protein